jgi:very-short-patch-repair endonuclease
MTPSEKKVWGLLRGRRFSGFKFRRQHPLGKYTVDFYCAIAALVLELDGESHVGKETADRNRRQWLEKQGLKVIRCWDNEVFDSYDGLQELIWHECQARSDARVAVNP